MTLRSHRWISLSSAVLALLSYEVLPLSAQAQDNRPTTGTIIGRVIDKASGVALQDVGIQVVGLESVGTSTSATGQYTIRSIPAGTVTLQFRRVGYQPKTVTAISLSRGETETVDVTLDAFVVTLTTAVVTAAAERGTVHESLNSQKEASAVVSSVTAEQIARSPDGDAAAVAQRASGVNLQDGKFLTARGQQERATTAYLNNVRIPSPEPEKKQVPFDLFPSSLIRSIDVVKTFTPDQPGDFSGALVNIQTKEFPSQRTSSWSSSVGFNASAASQQILASPMAGMEWLAFASGDRRLPSSVRAAGNFNDRTYPQSEINQMIGSFRNRWTPIERSGNLNSSLGMSFGGNDDVLGRQLGYIASVSYSAAQEVRQDENRALIDFGTGNSPANEFTGSTGRTSVLWGGILNLSTIAANGTLITLNNMYNRTSDSEAHRDVGRDENLGLENILERTTLSYVERTVRSNQLSGQHPLAGGGQFDWALANSAVTRREPDRSDMVYISTLDATTNTQNPFTLFASSSDGARRTFADLAESSWNLTANYKLPIGDQARESSLKFGVLARTTQRDAEVLQYAFTALAPMPMDQAQLSAEEIFDGRFTQDNTAVFTISPLGQSGSYEASDLMLAGYAMADYGLTERIQLIGGARVEHSFVKVVSEDLFLNRRPVEKVFTDALPALGLNISLSETQQLRLSASRTLLRPEYRELSPILNRDVLGGQGFRGDTSLVRTLINNYDVRWEWYPNPGELVSVALFAKHHYRPIERIEVPTSGTSVLSFINAESADNYGVEIELRKRLENLAYALRSLTIFSNVTLMTSEIRLGAANASAATNPNRALTGQAPYIINAGVTYATESGRFSATALYNRVGKRISAAGPAPLPDVYEMPRDVVDLSLRVPVLSALDAKLDARNLFDAPFEMRQGAVTRLSYTTGRIYSLGLSWKP